MAKSDETKETGETKFPQTVDIEHHRSTNFISEFASGTLFSGPTGDGLYHLIFFTDVIGINKEIGEFSEDIFDATPKLTGVAYKTSIAGEDIHGFREDKARISLNINSITALRDLLNRQFPPEDTKTEDKDDSSESA